MWKSVKKVWDAVKGNVYFEILKAAFTFLGGGALLAAVWSKIQAYRGIPQTDLKGTVILAMLISTFLLLVRIVAKRVVRPQIATVPMTPPPLPPAQAAGVNLTEPKKPLAAPRPVDFQGKILELYFHDLEGVLLFAPMKILMKVWIVNRGPDVATIPSCSLEIKLGDFRRTADVTSIPTNWRIKRPKQELFGVTYEETTIDPHISPDQTYQKGIPRTGWLAFEFYNQGHAQFPNAEFIIHLQDSLGGYHKIRREPMVYEKTGEIVIAGLDGVKQLGK